MTKLDWSKGELADGLRCYRAGEFFAAHEHWESVWLTLSEPEKTFLQAVIQVAAAFHHFQQGNRLGTSSLLNGARYRLERLSDEFGGVDVAELRADIAIWLHALQRGGDTEGLIFPRIVICGADGRSGYESR
jgi:predicted metal-dependent hydrolase